MKPHYPRADIDCLYIKRVNGGRRLISVENCMRVELEGLMRYLVQNKETLLVTIRNEGVLKAEKGGNKNYKENMKNNYATKDYRISSM